MRSFTAVIERCSDTGLFVGYVPGFPGAHSQGETLDELQRNLTEVIGMLLEDGDPQLQSEVRNGDADTRTGRDACSHYLPFGPLFAATVLI